ncbi:MAG: hypothetical protein B7733_16550 [Myxococcales bacterium FL481]|nr:MAG: hypothetical protein B7733_16550 [Myxococcales bacterium FL481]
MASARTQLTALWLLGGILAVVGIGVGLREQPPQTESTPTSESAAASESRPAKSKSDPIPNRGRDYLRDVEANTEGLSRLADEGSQLARDYIVRETSAAGRFTYRKHVDNQKVKRKYNILRHSGTMYSLGMLAQRDMLNDEAKAALARAATHLRENYIAGVDGRPGLLAVYSKKGEEKSVSKTPEVKLGGVGLALVGLLAARAQDPESIPLEELQKLARFVLFMMQDDGSFHSKWSVDRQFDYDFKSLFYPGEAILGLVTLYQVDSNREWLDAAAKAAGRLVISRRGQKRLPPDHWLLIATSALLPVYSDATSPSVSADELYQHVVDIADQMLVSQRRYLGGDDAVIKGAFDHSGGCTGASTRLEGLVALYDLAAKRGDEDVKRRLRPALGRGGEFVLRCQVIAGPMQGAIVRNAFVGSKPRDARRQREVQIDYVQHAMSSLLGIARICESGC